MEREIFSTERKALRINLNRKIYGTFAEIGAGQEVARNFFIAGGASGTVAKTMSAYDMAFSNAIYGEKPGTRYVSRERVRDMLDHEYGLLPERLTGEEYSGHTFFAFADSVATLNYHGTNDPHAWLGLRFQLRPGSLPNDFEIHVRLLGGDANLQQDVLGVLGVNMLFAAYNYQDDPQAMIESLVDNLPRGSVEIDIVSLNGPDFKTVDNRLLSLFLVLQGYSGATIFGPDGSLYQPKDLLYKKNVIVTRGWFRPITLVNVDMIQSGIAQFKKENQLQDDDQQVVLLEITLGNLKGETGDIEPQDFIDRADILCSMGYMVMVSNFERHHRLARFLSRCKPERVGMIVGVMNMLQFFDPSNYRESFTGELLHSMGELFSRNVKLYSYPYRPEKDGKIITTENIELPKEARHLFHYLRDNGYIKEIEGYNPDMLQIFAPDVLAKIVANEPGWEEQVPPEAANMIKDRCLFNYPCDLEKRRKKVKKWFSYTE